MVYLLPVIAIFLFCAGVGVIIYFAAFFVDALVDRKWPSARRPLRLLASMAVALAVALALIQVGTWVVRACAEPEYDREIDRVYRAWWLALHDEHFDEAYNAMSPEYRRLHTLAVFTQECRQYGDPHFMLRRGTMQIHGDRAKLYVSYWEPGTFYSGPAAHFVRVGGVWYLTGRVEMIHD